MMPDRIDELLALGHARLAGCTAGPFDAESKSVESFLHMVTQEIADLLAVDNPTTVWL